MKKRINTEKVTTREKCSYKDCSNRSIGYFIGENFGLFLCKKHKIGVIQK